MVIAHNMMADFANRYLGINNRYRAKTAERLASGYRINRAADDAAGLTISEKMRGQIRGLERGAKNIQDGISFCNVADGALNEVQNILLRMRELSVQSANDTNVSEDRDAINKEIKALKKEINRISTSTEFNTQKIFVLPLEIDFNHDFKVVKIFDANNGDPSDPDSYGGIIVRTPLGEDTRIAWNNIDSNMVYADPATGKTMFNGGNYTYDTGSFILDIECKDGDMPPRIKASFKVSADGNGINVAGETIAWSNVLNEDDESILNHIGEAGYYHFKTGDGIGSFYVPEFDSLNELADRINANNTIYERKYVNEYAGYGYEQAVDITNNGSRLKVDNTLYDMLINRKDMDLRLKADNTGIWIVKINEDGTDGTALTGSKKSWSDMGINSWNSLADISDKKIYEYRYNNDNNDIRFNYTLLDETSLESVIDGINNASVWDTSITVNNKIDMNFIPGNGLISGQLLKSIPNISIYDEAALGRDFDIQRYTFSNGDMSYDAASDKLTLTFPNSVTGSPAVTFTSGAGTVKEVLKNNALIYENYLTARRVQSLLSGNSATFPRLEDVIGNSNVTASSQVILDISTMKMTNGIYHKFGRYDVATMDFSGLGSSYQLYDLLGTGFNSNCATCSNHYSTMFVWGGTDKVSSNGYGYSMVDDGNNNYTLQIDIKSMMEKGISSGSQFTDALIGIMKESRFDFHFQQYVADGSKLYICDNRQIRLGSFDTEPYEVNTCTLNVDMKKSDGLGGLDMIYRYDLTSDLSPYAEKVQSVNGEFVDDGTGKLVKYNHSDYYNPNGTLRPPYTSEPQRYNIEIRGKVDSWDNYYDNVMGKIADQTLIDLKSTDYDYVKFDTNEKPNQATVSNFDFYIEDNKAFWIQAGANAGQGIVLDWDRFSTYSLGIGAMDVLTRDNATEMISGIDVASKIICGIRSDFGSFTNRLEHAYASNQNTKENTQAAESRIRDADMAKEITEYSKHNIILQAGQSVLAQANQIPQGVLGLLQ